MNRRRAKILPVLQRAAGPSGKCPAAIPGSGHLMAPAAPDFTKYCASLSRQFVCAGLVRVSGEPLARAKRFACGGFVSEKDRRRLSGPDCHQGKTRQCPPLPFARDSISRRQSHLDGSSIVTTCNNISFYNLRTEIRSASAFFFVRGHWHARPIRVNCTPQGSCSVCPSAR
jgi:hypothetical protein